ncbi:MAG: type III secretion system gatekeeper subunit SctW [Desulfobacterium sp.]|nr:type III secretion system gatekeeper subunit SctW [Desulfobacterium sp.]
MDIGNIGNQFQHQVGHQGQAGAAGSFAGQAITVSDPLSLIMDSAEEAGFAMSEREKSRLDETKMKSAGPNTDRVEQIEKYIELMDRQGKGQTLDAFIKALSQKKGLNPRQAVQEARKFFGNTADAYAALQYAKKELAETFDGTIFLEAMDQLEDIAGENIRTELAAGVAALDHAVLGDAESLKQLYGATLADLGSPVNVYDRVINEYGEDRFEEALAFLTRSLGNDMAATTINTDRVHLEGISRDLGTVSLLHGLNAQCKALNARLEKGGHPSELTTTEMVKEILKLRDSHFVGAFDIEGIADRVGVKEIEQRITFFQDLSNTARDFSENLFPDSGGRLNIIQAIQTALDDAIAVEEEMYE